eukprot:134414_1
MVDMEPLYKASPRRKSSVNNVYKCFCSRTKPTILSGEDMEAIQGRHTRNNSNYSNSMSSTICDEYAMDQTLCIWQVIDGQLHQIESLFKPSGSSCCGSEMINEDRKSQTASCCGSEPGDSMENQHRKSISHSGSCCGSERADSRDCFVSEDEKDMEFSLQLDLDDLPRRLSDIYNKTVILYSDAEEVHSLKEEYKTMTDKVDTMTIEKHTAQMRLRKALKEVDELNGMMSDLQNTIETKDEEIGILQTDVNGYKRRIDEIMKSQNLSDRRVFISLQQQVDSLKLEAANYRKDIFALKNKQIDYDRIKKESIKANSAFERGLSKKIEERVLIENELQSMRRQYEILQQERVDAIDRHKRIKDSLWHEIDDQITQIESLLMSDIASLSVESTAADLPRRLEWIYNKMESEMTRIRNELDELDSLKEEHKTLQTQLDVIT